MAYQFKNMRLHFFKGSRLSVKNRIITGTADGFYNQINHNFRIPEHMTGVFQHLDKKVIYTVRGVAFLLCKRVFEYTLAQMLGQEGQQ